MRVPVPSVGPAGGTGLGVKNPWHLLMGSGFPERHKTRYRRRHKYMLYTYTYTYNTLSHTLPTTQVPAQPRRSRASIPSRKPVERQRRAECVPPLVWHERDMPVSQEGERMRLPPTRSSPQRQLAEGTCDFVPPTAFFGLGFLFFSFSLICPLFFFVYRLIALEETDRPL